MKKISAQNQNGLIVPLIIFAILALGLAGGLYLVKNPNLNIFKSQASSAPIEVKATDGSSFIKEGDVFVIDPAKVSPLAVKLELTSPLGGPKPSGGTSGNTGRPSPCGNYGDFDGDGLVTGGDGDGLTALLNKTDIVPDNIKKVVDVDNDGTVRDYDALLIKRYADGTDSTFKVCSSGKPTSSSSRKLSCEIYGDLDRNNAVNGTDAEIALQFYQGKKPAIAEVLDDTTLKTAADVSGDGNVTPEDSQMINDYADNKLSDFPVCQSAKPLPCGSLGDHTNNGRLTTLDASENLRIILGKKYNLYGKEFTNEDRKNAETNGDGRLDVNDSLEVARYARGEITTLKGCAKPIDVPAPAPVIDFGGDSNEGSSW